MAAETIPGGDKTTKTKTKAPSKHTMAKMTKMTRKASSNRNWTAIIITIMIITKSVNVVTHLVLPVEELPVDDIVIQPDATT